MKRSLLVLMMLVVGSLPASAEMLRPSCEVLLSFGDSGRNNAVELSFGKPVNDMTAEDFTRALDAVQACMDKIAAGPADIPGLQPREQKATQLTMLSVFLEEIRFYRSREREREAERRALK